MSAAQDAGRARNRWPEHLSLHTAPIEQRRRVTAPLPQAVPQAAPRARPTPTPARQPPRAPSAAVPQRRPAPHPAGRLTAPQLRRRWIGGIASALLIGGTLPVQLGAIAIESLELLSPGPDGTAMTVVLTAMTVQLLVLLIPMFVGPAIGGFSRRWRARLIVAGSNAALVGAIAAFGWFRISQL